MLTRRSFLTGGAVAATTSLALAPHGSNGSPEQVATLSKAPLSETINKVATGRPLALNQVKAYGWLAERVDRAMVALDNLSAAVWWNAIGMWGYTLPATWLRDVLFTEQYAGTSHPRLSEVANQLITMQAEGRLRLDYPQNKIGVYEDGELIRGLVAYYHAHHDVGALDAAKSVGRFIEENRHLTQHYYNGLAVAPLLKLADASGEIAFADLAKNIAEEEQLKCLEVKEGTHGAVPSMIGEAYLGLFEKTGNRRYLDWALHIWKVMRERMFVTGGIGEVLFFTRPPEESSLHDETCQTSWWFMFNLATWRVTGDVKYLDLAEHILLNHFSFQQLHRGEGEGGFHALGDVDQGFRGDHNYFCCDVEGPFGYFELLRHVYTCDARRRVVNVNFFFDSEATAKLSSGVKVRLRQETTYPNRGVVTLVVETPPRTDFTLRIRVPSWTRLSSIRVNGTVTATTVEDSYVNVRRVWQGKEMVEVVFPLPLRVETDNTGDGARPVAVSMNGEPRVAKRVAVFFGPLAVAIFRCGHNNDLSWVWTGDYPEVLDSGGSVFANYPTSKAAVWEADDERRESSGAAEHTEITVGETVPTLRWSAGLGEKIQVDYEVKVLPGLPVTLDYREEVQGWDGKGRLLCSGMRLATLKRNENPRYKQRPNAWLYPTPTFTSKPELSNVDNLEYQAGTFGLYEPLVDDGALSKTGVAMLNNGYFRAISLYDVGPVQRVTCRQSKEWVGVYLEPVAGEKVALHRRLVIPLHARPWNQSMVKQMAERAQQVRAVWEGEGQLKLEGPAVEGAIVVLSKATGLRAGGVLHNARLASQVWEYDADYLLVFADVPGTYQVRQN